jgi:GMP synthase-like glutamine amidotransferase
MKPVAIFRHFGTEGPGYFATFLDRRSIPWQLIRIDAGDPVPGDTASFSGLVFMGGPMSVNDDLPWISHSLSLIRAAVTADIPVLGHCLGGQLMAKALGGSVTRNPIKEIGWGEARVLDTPEARDWFGDVSRFPAFHWHGETFSIPDGGVRILDTAYCANQAFAFGKHLALQCHVEMTANAIREWCQAGAAEIAEANSPGVQPAVTILAEIPGKLAAMTQVADRLYARWLDGLVSA